MDLTERDDELFHYGMPRRSGRYPWGSGEHPFQHTDDFLSRVEELEKEGMNQKEIAKALGLKTTELRTQISLAKGERRSLLVATAKGLKEKGYSPTEIARQMGYNNESSVRSLLNEDSEARMNAAIKTANFLKDQVDTKGMIDIGAGVEVELGISKEKMREALYYLQQHGYEVYAGRFPQATNPNRMTTQKVLCPPGTEHKDIYKLGEVNTLNDYISYDGGESFHKSFEYPSSLSSKRLDIVYGDKGGSDKDGLVEIRPGVKDLSLGESNYAQVRIMVDGTHYIKGMAVYNADLPEGVDVRFNTNKPSGTPVTKVLKEIKDDPDNPFGSLIKEHGGQSYYDDPNGKYTDPVTGKKQSLSLINKRAEEGDWKDWKDKVPSQFLSKQNKNLIKSQLNITVDNATAEYNDILEVNNPTIKKKLLADFADGCDAAAVHLKAAALPRQKYQVILPLTTIKDNEVYAPNFYDGEKVALIRYPHGGTFEIPILTVNNRNKEGKKMMGSNPLDAVGINSTVAARLSGADYDGDTVMVIPTNDKVKITSTPYLKQLVGFDPKMAYPERPGMKYMSKEFTQNQMGQVSNLITDMTLKKASDEEIARAVKHSMVVIDAHKHKLDYKQSEYDNGIAALKKKYQGHYDENGEYHEGASTLISRAKAQKSVVKRQGAPIVNEDGSISWKESDRAHWVDKEGKVHTRHQKSTQMAETNDARTLISDFNTPTEIIYADYANKMKAMANTARKEVRTTGNLKYNPEANKLFKNEVASLTAQLNQAKKNAPRERQAQRIVNSVMKAKKESCPDMDKEEEKKVRQQVLAKARAQVGAKRYPITINDKEWEAIQSGAISETVLNQILKYADVDSLRERATPRSKNELSSGKVSRIKGLASRGYTNDEIAKILKISISTVGKYLK